MTSQDRGDRGGGGRGSTGGGFTGGGEAGYQAKGPDLKGASAPADKRLLQVHSSTMFAILISLFYGFDCKYTACIRFRCGTRSSLSLAHTARRNVVKKGFPQALQPPVYQVGSDGWCVSSVVTSHVPAFLRQHAHLLHGKGQREDAPTVDNTAGDASDGNDSDFDRDDGVRHLIGLLVHSTCRCVSLFESCCSRTPGSVQSSPRGLLGDRG